MGSRELRGLSDCSYSSRETLMQQISPEDEAAELARRVVEIDVRTAECEARRVERDAMRAECEARLRAEEFEAGSRALHAAAREGNDAEMLRLLPLLSPDQISAAMSTKNHDGRTALHHASGSGHQAVVKVLLDNGAEVEPRDNRGLKPQHLATAGKYLHITTMLKAEVRLLSLRTCSV